MNPTNTQLLSLLYGEQVQPAIVENTTVTVTENNQSSELPTIYIGYPLSSCKGTYDKKWLIKRIQTVANAQEIKYANGVRKFDCAWNDRASLTYKFNENF
jgi:hypothetical protein